MIYLDIDIVIFRDRDTDKLWGLQETGMPRNEELPPELGQSRLLWGRSDWVDIRHDIPLNFLVGGRVPVSHVVESMYLSSAKAS